MHLFALLAVTLIACGGEAHFRHRIYYDENPMVNPFIPQGKRFTFNDFNRIRRVTSGEFPKANIPNNLKYDPGHDNIYKVYTDKAKKTVTFFEKVERTGKNTQYLDQSKVFNKEKDKVLEWVELCLQDWKDQGYPINAGNTAKLAQSGKTKMEKETGVRLDQQKRYPKGGRQYVNLQLQMNGKFRQTKNGYSTTVGEVQVPVEMFLPTNPGFSRVLEAFEDSVKGGFGVYIARFQYTNVKGKLGAIS